MMDRIFLIHRNNRATPSSDETVMAPEKTPPLQQSQSPEPPMPTPPTTPEASRKRYSMSNKPTPTRIGQVLSKVAEVQLETVVEGLGSRLDHAALSREYKAFVVQEGLTPVTDATVKDHVNRCIHAANHILLTPPINEFEFAESQSQMLSLLFARDRGYYSLQIFADC
jgi:hypothetical protein